MVTIPAIPASTQGPVPSTTVAGAPWLTPGQHTSPLLVTTPIYNNGPGSFPILYHGWVKFTAPANPPGGYIPGGAANRYELQLAVRAAWGAMNISPTVVLDVFTGPPNAGSAGQLRSAGQTLTLTYGTAVTSAIYAVTAGETYYLGFRYRSNSAMPAEDDPRNPFRSTKPVNVVLQVSGLPQATDWVDPPARVIRRYGALSDGQAPNRYLDSTPDPDWDLVYTAYTTGTRPGGFVDFATATVINNAAASAVVLASQFSGEFNITDAFGAPTRVYNVPACFEAAWEHCWHSDCGFAYWNVNGAVEYTGEGQASGWLPDHRGLSASGGNNHTVGWRITTGTHLNIGIRGDVDAWGYACSTKHSLLAMLYAFNSPLGGVKAADITAPVTAAGRTLADTGSATNLEGMVQMESTAKVPTIQRVWASPDEAMTPNASSTGTTRWLVGVAKAQGTGTSVGPEWGPYNQTHGIMSAQGPQSTSWTRGGPLKTDRSNLFPDHQFLCEYSGGIADWYEVPSSLWQEALRQEQAIMAKHTSTVQATLANDARHSAALEFVGISPDMASPSAPYAPVGSDNGSMTKTRVHQRVNLAMEIKPTRYKIRLRPELAPVTVPPPGASAGATAAIGEARRTFGRPSEAH